MKNNFEAHTASEDELIHKVSTEGLPETVEEERLERELDRHEALEQIFGGNNIDEQKIARGRTDWYDYIKRGWTKIGTPKSKIQQDTEITKAQRESPRNQ